MTVHPQLNPDAKRKCVDMLLSYSGTPREHLYEYPHRSDDSDRYIKNAESLLARIIEVAQPAGWETRAKNFMRVIDRLSAENQMLNTAARQVVATVAELDALPAGTVVLDERGRVWTAFWPVTHNVDMPARSRVTVNRWQCADGGVVEGYGWFGGEFMEGSSPLTVLHLPEVARG